MSQSLPETSSTLNYQVIFDNALKAYKNKTGNDLASNPLTRKLESCNSPDAVLHLLRGQIPGFNQSGSSHDAPMKWLDPTVNVLYAFSSTIGGAVSLVSLGKIGLVHAGLRSNISIADLPTCRGDLHGNRLFALGGCLPSSCYFLCTALMTTSFRQSKV